jgi:hypothetical protein
MAGKRAFPPTSLADWQVYDLPTLRTNDEERVCLYRSAFCGRSVSSPVVQIDGCVVGVERACMNRGEGRQSRVVYFSRQTRAERLQQPLPVARTRHNARYVRPLERPRRGESRIGHSLGCQSSFSPSMSVLLGSINTSQTRSSRDRDRNRIRSSRHHCWSCSK